MPNTEGTSPFFQQKANPPLQVKCVDVVELLDTPDKQKDHSPVSVSAVNDSQENCSSAEFAVDLTRCSSGEEPDSQRNLPISEKILQQHIKVKVLAEKKVKSSLSQDSRETEPIPLLQTQTPLSSETRPSLPIVSEKAVDPPPDESNPAPNLFSKFAFGNQTVLSATDLQCKRSALLPKTHVRQNSKKLKRDEKKNWIRMKELSSEEYANVVQKWHGLISNDEEATIDDRRFEMLIAALLHARCQEPTVRQALNQLRTVCGAKFLTVADLAAREAVDLQESISCLQYYSTKAKYIVGTARQLRDQFSGKVPKTERDLKELCGIGEVFSDLLSEVNTEEHHLTWRESHASK